MLLPKRNCLHWDWPMNCFTETAQEKKKTILRGLESQDQLHGQIVLCGWKISCHVLNWLEAPVTVWSQSFKNATFVLQCCCIAVQFCFLPAERSAQCAHYIERLTHSSGCSAVWLTGQPESTEMTLRQEMDSYLQIWLLERKSYGSEIVEKRLSIVNDLLHLSIMWQLATVCNHMIYVPAAI